MRETVRDPSPQDSKPLPAAEKHLKGVATLLELFTTRPSRETYLESAVRFLRAWCGCACAGVRLLEKDGRLPFAAKLGFSRKFIEAETERSLPQGDCPCLRLLRGEIGRKERKVGTSRGSFLCNHTWNCAPLRTKRNGDAPLPCLEARFGSLAQTPIRHGGQLVGTIHLADPEPDKFSAETMSFVETVAPLVGEAVRRFAVTEALRESEGRFRSMFERNNAMMLLIDPDSGALVDVNPAAAAFYGYARERMRGMNLDELSWLPPGSIETLRRLAQCEHQNFFVFPHRLANEETRTVELHAEPIEVSGERLLLTTVTDVSDRKLLERQLLDAGEAERQRIGQDLHDSVGGKLTGAALMSKALAQALAAKGLAESGLAEEIVQCINQAIAETRTVARGLCPVELSDSGLADGLQEYAHQIGRHSGVQCTFHLGEGVAIRSSLVSSHLFRIAQEAVSNALRHAQPSHIGIHLGKVGADVVLEVRNDGRALPPTPKLATGLGLRTMRHRAEIIGAQLTVKPGETGGAVVWCLLPAATLAAHEAASSYETRR